MLAVELEGKYPEDLNKSCSGRLIVHSKYIDFYLHNSKLIGRSRMLTMHVLLLVLLSTPAVSKYIISRYFQLIITCQNDSCYRELQVVPLVLFSSANYKGQLPTTKPSAIIIYYNQPSDLIIACCETP